MADYTTDKKILGLDNLPGSSVASGDGFPIGDVSDSGKAKYVLQSEMLVALGLTATAAQLNRVDATSSIQTQLDGKQATGSYLTSANIVETITNGVTTKSTSENAVFDALALKIDKSSVPCEFIVACSDLSTALTTGTTKAYFRAPYAFTLTAVRASLGTAQTSGSILTVDINDSGTSVLSTKLTIDNTELTSQTAATPPVISDSAIADDAIIAIDIDQVGDGTAKGLIVTLIGTHPV